MLDQVVTNCSIEDSPELAAAEPPRRRPAWSVIIPFYNEVGYLPKCLESLAGQTLPFDLVLIDNASTDGSGTVARRLCDELGIEATHLVEHRPGKVAALQRGLAAARTKFVATCDADTIYPAGYLERASRLLEDRTCVAAVASTTPPGASPFEIRASGLRIWLTSFLLSQQCLNGGAGQVFRTSALRSCGGFDPAIWNWVLEDHEIIARIETFGRISYSTDFHCHPTIRPKAVDCRGWTIWEQLRYHFSSSHSRVGFFHGFLAPRLRARTLSSEKLRCTMQVQVIA